MLWMLAMTTFWHLHVYTLHIVVLHSLAYQTWLWQRILLRQKISWNIAYGAIEMSNFSVHSIIATPQGNTWELGLNACQCDVGLKCASRSMRETWQASWLAGRNAWNLAGFLTWPQPNKKVLQHKNQRPLALSTKPHPPRTVMIHLWDASLTSAVRKRGIMSQRPARGSFAPAAYLQWCARSGLTLLHFLQYRMSSPCCLLVATSSWLALSCGTIPYKWEKLVILGHFLL